MVHISKTKINLPKRTGVFHCPSCRQARPYQLRSVREFLTIYFVPIFPLGELGEHVLCTVCKDEFDPKVLAAGPAAAVSARRLESKHVTRGVILGALRLILGDNRTSAHELSEAQRLIRDRTGIRSTFDEIEGLRRLVTGPEAPTTAEILARTPGLNDVHQERAVRDLFLVASADGDLRPFQVQELAELPRRLGIKPGRFRRLIGQAAAATEPQPEPLA